MQDVHSATQSRPTPQRFFALIIAVSILCTAAWAGDEPNSSDKVVKVKPTVETAAVEKEQPIQDNSFLIEEAYNQEFGVVQHINTFTRSWNTHQWVYTFTQEWPIPGQTHQLSYTLSYLNSGSSGTPGIGDAAINYRYQLLGSGETRLAFAPRISLLLPSGNFRLGRGFGGTGIQTNLPLSWVISKHLVTHWNAGATFVPHARNDLGERAATNGYNLGQSIIWLAHPRFNVMLETLWTGSESVTAPGRTQRSHDLVLSPGVRWAHNFSNGLQVVPGIGVPIGVGPSAGERGVFVYLSFEHPFRALGKR